MEEEQNGSLEKAVEFYRKAWDITKSKKNVPATLAYRLAESLLGNREILDCIEVCNEFFEVIPASSYPNLKNDVLDKAVALLRT